MSQYICIIFGIRRKILKSDSSILTMSEALSSEASSINVLNTESELNRFYNMNVPFQITLEYCSGFKPDDYINIVTLSAKKALLYQETLSSKNHPNGKEIMHFHDYFEFLFVLDGSIIHKIEGKDYLYSAGSCCLINRSVCHLELYNKCAKVLFVGISPDFICELFDSARTSSFHDEKKIYDSEIYRFINDDLNTPGKKAYLDFIPTYRSNHNTEHLHALTEAIIHTLLYPDFGASCRIRGFLGALLTYLSSAQYYHCTKIQLNTGSDFLIFARISRLFEECDGRMNRSTLEKLLNYSGDYLNRIVKKYTGMCLYEYGMDFCLKRAARYLTESDESASAIAARLKFTNRTHFYNLFKNKYGVTPREYRKQH